MKDLLEKEFKYYLEHQDELVKKFNGRVIVIKDGQVVGDYDNEFEAVKKASEKYEIGTFLVQKCETGNNSYNQTFHSRVVFSKL